MFQRAFSVSTREPAARFLRAGGRLPHGGCLLYVATLERLCDCVLACRVLSGGHVPLFAQLHVCMIVAVPCLWPSCMAVHGRRACGRGVVAVITAVPCPPWPSVMSWLWP